MEDPYKVLGVKREATADEIRRAYRKLAKLHHPDVNPGKPKAAERFKEIAAANDLLSDPAKRTRFDRGEIDASGAERPPERRFYSDFSDHAGRSKYSAAPDIDDAFLHNIFSEAVGERPGAGFAIRGDDVRYRLVVEFLEAAKGAAKRLTLPDGRILDVTIPPGLRNGQVLRLKRQGMPGFGDGPPGDAMIEVEVVPHPLFKRDGNDLILELPVTLNEAILGAKIDVPTIDGRVSLTVPPHSGRGRRLRMKGRGITAGGQTGDQYVELKVVLPSETDPALKSFLESWTPEHPDNPREDFERKAGERMTEARKS